MKRLEFKSILARFDVQEMGGNVCGRAISGAWRICPERSRFLKRPGMRSRWVCQLILSENGVGWSDYLHWRRRNLYDSCSWLSDRQLPV